MNIYAKTSKAAEIFLYGSIGESFFEESIDAKSVIDLLSEAGEMTDIKVRINSPGGSVWDGFSIYNALKSHRGKVSVQVDGLAASIASVIAMAADPGKLTMGEGAMMMIHDPWQLVMGDANDLRRAADVLDKVGDGLVKAYMDRTGLPEADIRQLMADETYFTVAEAIELGLVDGSFKQEKIAACADSAIFAHFKKFPKPAASGEPEKPAPGVTGEQPTKPVFQPVRVVRS